MAPTPRSAGKLTIGIPQFNRGVFHVDMIFESATSSVGEDEMKSAALVVKQQFLQLLHQNGFWDHGVPDVRVQQVDGRRVVMVVGTRARKGKPEIIGIKDSVN